MIFASGQGLIAAIWLVVLVVVLTLGSLGAGIGLCLSRAHGKLGHRVLRVAVLVAALEFGAVLVGLCFL